MEERSSSVLVLEVLIYFNRFYTFAYTIISLVMFAYKNYSLKYPPNTLAPEVVGTLVLFLYELIRLNIGSKANRGESVTFTLWFMMLTLPAVFCILFFMFLQTFVFVADLFVNSIEFVFMVLEFVLGILALLRFRREDIRYKLKEHMQ